MQEINKSVTLQTFIKFHLLYLMKVTNALLFIATFVKHSWINGFCHLGQQGDIYRLEWQVLSGRWGVDFFSSSVGFLGSANATSMLISLSSWL